MRRVSLALVTLLALGTVVPSASAAFVERPADIAVEQPHYIEGGVTTTSTNGSTVYRASGPVVRIQPQNFDGSNVTESGIGTTGANATLSYDQDMQVYTLETSENATIELYWVVREGVQVGNSTEVRDVRYEAQLRVQQTDIEHVQAGTIDQYRSDAANWSAFEAGVREVVGNGANIEQEAQTAINLLDLKYNPLSALTGEFTGLLVTLFITIPGLVIVLLAVGGHLVSRRKDITEQRRQRQLDAERAELEDELDAFEEHERLSALEGMDWNDIFDDATARAFREHLGETVLDGWLTIQSVLTPETLVRDRLRAMSDTHVAVEEPAPDGGAGEGPSWTLVPWGETAEDTDAAVQELAEPSDEVVDGIDWDDPELREFDLSAADIEHSLEIETLTEELDIDTTRNFDSEEAFTEYLVEFLDTVVGHDYTDADGRVRPMRHALNLWLRTLRVVGEREGVPTARYSAEHVESLLRSYDSESQIAKWVNRVETGQEGV